MNFYLVTFWDKRDKDVHEHYLYTSNINEAKTKIEAEEPYVKVMEWKLIQEHELPDLVIVIQK